MNLFIVLVIVLHFLLLVTIYSSLPNLVPFHMKLNGSVSKYVDKNLIFIIPLLNFVIFIFIYFFTSKPQILNYGIQITEKNREREYSRMQKSLTILNFVISIIFISLSVSFFVISNKFLYFFIIGILVISYIISFIYWKVNLK